jgi:hypothetical protein
MAGLPAKNPLGFVDDKSNLTFLTQLEKLIFMNSILDLLPDQLRNAADIKSKIIALEKQLEQFVGGAAKTIMSSSPPPVAKRRKMSAAGRANIAAAAKARWAKAKAEQK